MAIHLHRDEARHGQRLQRIDLAEPRLEQRRRFVHASGRTRAMPGWRREKRRHVGDRLLGVDVILGLDLDRNLAGDILQPGIRRLADHVDGARREAGKEAHDRRYLATCPYCLLVSSRGSISRPF